MDGRIKTTINDQISKISDLLKIQNRRFNEHLEYNEQNYENKRKSIKNIIDKYDSIKNLAQEELLPALKKIKNNNRYSFQFIDNEIEKNSEIGEIYFKIIIKNNISNVENFFSITYDIHDFTIKTKPLNPEKNLEINEYKFVTDNFSKAKFRQFFFGYLEEIISLDTYSKLAKNLDINNRKTFFDNYHLTNN